MPKTFLVLDENVGKRKLEKEGRKVLEETPQLSLTTKAKYFCFEENAQTKCFVGRKESEMSVEREKCVT